MPNHQFTTPRVVYVGRPHGDDDGRDERHETRAPAAPATGRASQSAAAVSLKPSAPSSAR